MKLISLFGIILIAFGCVPSESANTHYTIKVANQSEQRIYVTFDRSYFAHPSKGVVDYYKFKLERPGDIKTPRDYLILPGEINRTALDIGSWDGYNCIEVDMSLCNWIIYFVDADFIDSRPLEELDVLTKGFFSRKNIRLKKSGI